MKDVREPWENLTYQDLSEKDKRALRNSNLRATIFETRDRKNFSEAMNEVFDRLNTGGTPLSEQEIRNCVYEGKIINYLDKLNENKSWRNTLNKPKFDERARDILLIVRVLALYKNWQNYEKPMRKYLDTFSEKYKDAEESEFKTHMEIFESIVNFVYNELGKDSFRSNKKRGVSPNVLDSVFIALSEIGIENVHNFKEKYENLINDEDFIECITKATTNDETLKNRIKIAMKYLR